MSHVFNAEEVLEIACQIERNGARYYRRAAEVLEDVKASELLLSLAAMEDDHESAFRMMQEALSERTDLMGNPDEVGTNYLRALASGNVFPLEDDPGGQIAEGTSLEDILRKAIGMEKDSIIYYLGMRDAMPEELGRDKVKMIIREEMRHVAILSDKLSMLMRAH
jgi:rubrerythrin